MPAGSSKEYWTNKLLPLCETASKFIIARYKSDPALTPEQLWDDYLLQCFPKTPYAPLSKENEEARLKDIKELVGWAETIRTPDGQVPAAPGLLEQVNRFGVSRLIPKQIFLTLADSDLRPVEGIRILVHQPSVVAHQFAACICGETYEEQPSAPLIESKETQPVRRIRKAPPPPAVLSGRAEGAPEPAEPACRFTHSDDYRSINFNGVKYTLTYNQATIIKILHDAFQRGTPCIGGAQLLAAVESETSRVQDSFKGSPLWQTLVVSGECRGTYRLNLSA